MKKIRIRFLKDYVLPEGYIKYAKGTEIDARYILGYARVTVEKAKGSYYIRLQIGEDVEDISSQYYISFWQKLVNLFKKF